MKLVTFLHDNKEAVGVLTEDGAAVRPLPFADMNALIQASREALLAAVKGAAATLPLSAVTLLAPIPRPRQDVICLGINYKAHTEEAARYSSEAFTKERPIPINFSKRVTRPWRLRAISRATPASWSGWTTRPSWQSSSARRRKT